MLIKKTLLILLITINCSNYFSQTTWANQKNAGVSDIQTEKVVVLENGQTFVLSGYQYSGGNQRWDANVAIYNNDGTLNNDLSANVRYSGNDNSTQSSNEMMHDADLMYGTKTVIVGGTNNGKDAVLFRLDGTTIISLDWGKKMIDGTGTDNTDFHAVTCTYDTNIVVAGSYIQGADVRSLFVKFDDVTQDTLWTKTYTGLSNIEYIEILETSDSGYVAIGITTDLGSTAGVVVRLDVNGNVIWSKYIRGPGYVITTGVTEGYNNDYLIACRTELTGTNTATYDVSVLRIDDNGTIIEQKLMEDLNSILPSEIVKTHTNNFALAYRCVINPRKKAGLISFDNNFNVNFSNQYVNNGPVKDVSMAYVPNDSTYTMSVHYNNQDYQYNFKTDQNGATNCWEYGEYPLSLNNSLSLSDSVLTLTLGGYVPFTLSDAHNAPVKTNYDLNGGLLNPSITSVSGDALCIGGSHGSIDVTGSNLIGGAAYLWSSGQTTQDITGLIAGVYSIEYTDNHYCYLTDTTTISEPDSILIMPILDKSDATCFGAANGSAWVTTTGGNGPYTYVWNTAGTNDTISNLAAATYSVIVTDAVNCSAGGVIVVGEASLLSHSLSTSDIICNGDSTGTAQVMLNNGAQPYTYTWSTGSNLYYDSTLIAGTHIITASDSCGTVIVDSVVINEPDALSVSVSTSDVLCNGQSNGSAQVTANSGTAPYTYLWSNSGSTNISNDNLSSMILDTIVVTDGCGATVLETYSITEPDLLNLTVTTTNVTCFGYGDGSATALLVGGTMPYTYLWNIGQNNQTAIGLFSGNYTVNIVDNNGCFATSFVSISEPLPISASFNITGTECGENNGQIEITPTNGVLPYNYSWSNGDSTSIISGLSSGGYNVTVTDSMGCFESFDSSQIGLIEVQVSPIELCVITVDDQNKNSLVWSKPISNSLAGFNIYRNIAGVYNQIGHQPYDSISNFIDNSFGVDPAITSYRYKISAIDSCGNESELSSFHETIHLTTNLGLNGEVNLIWDDYEGFPFGYYRILRDSTSTNTWEVIDSVTAGNFTYTDFNLPLSGAEYAIEVVTPFTCTAEKAQDHNTTRSNRQTMADPTLGISIGERNSIEFKVYPNPTNGKITLEHTIVGEGLISIQDLSGRVIYSEMTNQSILTLDISSLEKGIYFLTVQQGEFSKTKRIIKQ